MYTYDHDEVDDVVDVIKRLMDNIMIMITTMMISTLIRPLPRLANQQALQKQPFDKPHNHLSPEVMMMV